MERGLGFGAQNRTMGAARIAEKSLSTTGSTLVSWLQGRNCSFQRFNLQDENEATFTLLSHRKRRTAGGQGKNSSRRETVCRKIPTASKKHAQFRPLTKKDENRQKDSLFRKCALSGPIDVISAFCESSSSRRRRRAANTTPDFRGRLHECQAAHRSNALLYAAELPLLTDLLCSTNFHSSDLSARFSAGFVPCTFCICKPS